MNSTITKPLPDHRWVAIACLLAVLVLDAIVIVCVANFQPFFAGFGADLPSITSIMLRYQWLACSIFAAISLISAVFLFMRPQAPTAYFRVAYTASVSAAAGAFLWVNFVAYAVYVPIDMLGKP